MTSTPDLLRLLVVPFFAWAAYTDVKTRRIPNKVWGPLFAAGVVLLAVTIQGTYASSATYQLQRDLAAIAISLGVVAPVAYLFWLFGGFGGADAKALLVLSLLIPIYPTYELGSSTLPVYQSPLGSFAFTILTNTVLVGILFPLALFAKNAVNGEFALPMVLGQRVASSRVDEKWGTIMGTNDGMDAGKLDLDALRMYLTWRDATLAEIREDPAQYRDPDSLPAVRNDPGGGEIATDVDHRGEDDPESTANDSDGSQTQAVGDANEPETDDLVTDGPVTDDPVTDDPVTDDPVTDDDSPDPAEQDADGTDTTEPNADDTDNDDSEAADADEFEDPWGAEAFLEEIEGDAYGTRPAELRDGLEVLTSSETVWVSPGIPFIVPMFFGLVLALTVGDVLTGAMGLL